MQLIVLGMHRSGTSVLSRLLNLMGAYFGPEGIGTGANSENPKGFWERRDVRALNDAVLHAVGADWNRVSDFDVTRLPEQVTKEFLRSAAPVVLGMDAHRPWFLKEPRLCMLFPLWRQLLECPVVVRIVRHPVEVASSLRVRNGMPIPAGLQLWERYVRASDSASANLPAITISHRGLMTDPMSEIERLHVFLQGQNVPWMRMPSMREVEAFINPALYRERDDRPDLVQYRQAPQVEVFERLEAGLPLGAEPSLPPADLIAYERTLPAITPDASAKPASGTKPSSAEHSRDGTASIAAKLESTLRERDGQLSSRLIEIGRLQEQCERWKLNDKAVQEQLQERDGKIAQLRSREEEVERTNVRLQTELKLRAEAHAAMEAQFRHREEEVERTNIRLQSELKLGAEANVAMEARLKDVEGTLQRLRQEAEQTAMSLASSDARLVELKQRLAKQEATEADLTRQLREQRQLRAVAEASVDERFAEIARLTRLLLAREAELEAGIDERTEALARVSAELDLARSELVALRGSRSWKVSAPLRALKARLGRRRACVTEYQDERLVRESGMFDADWYLEAYPDVAAAGIDPLEHYLRFGAAEGRSPGTTFDAEAYLRCNPDVADAGANPLVHYLRHGSDEGRQLA